MKPNLWLLVIVLALGTTACSSTKQVGDVVYQRVAFPSLFGPYQAIIVSYPVGNTNLQQVVTKDSNVGPGSAIAGSAIQAAGYMGGQALRRPSKVSTSNTTTVDGAGGQIDFNGGDVRVDTGDVNVSGGTQDIHVDGNGNHPHN